MNPELGAGLVGAAECARRIRAGILSPREAVEQYLERIEALNGEINAYIAVRGDEALAEADGVPDGPLRGVPVGIKDVIDVAGVATTAASRVLDGLPRGQDPGPDPACALRCAHERRHSGVSGGSFSSISPIRGRTTSRKPSTATRSSSSTNTPCCAA